MTEDAVPPASPALPAMRLVAMKEARPGERRVAITPDTVKGYKAKGLDVYIESGAGAESLISDDDYRAAGAEIGGPELVGTADILVHVRPLLVEQVRQLKKGCITVGMTTGRHQMQGVQALRDQGCTTLAMELIPRISRAQSMDALTSQALIAGYQSVLEAATRMPRFFPMFMTAAGTIPPARVVVLGAGVAGLQAIATAKRLGAQVQAYDVRSASADEVRSMGGTFIELDLETADGAGGYAKELSEDRAKRQQDALAPYIAKADVVITTALIQGKNAPILVTREMIEQMGTGSVAIDMAADKGGNIEGSEPGVCKKVGKCRLYGMFNPTASMPVDASKMYAKNISNLLDLGLKEGQFTIDLEDEIMAGCCLISNGELRNERTATELAAYEADPTPEQSQEIVPVPAGLLLPDKEA